MTGDDASELALAVEEEFSRALSQLCHPTAGPAVYPLRFDDGFCPAVLEVSIGRQVVRPATPRELALIF